MAPEKKKVVLHLQKNYFDWILKCFNIMIRPLKKDACFPFTDRSKILENLFFFFFSIFNFAFLNKIVKIIIFKMHCNSLHMLTVLAQVYLFSPINVSTRFTYLNTENYMIYIAFLQHPDF